MESKVFILLALCLASTQAKSVEQGLDIIRQIADEVKLAVYQFEDASAEARQTVHNKLMEHRLILEKTTEEKVNQGLEKAKALKCDPEVGQRLLALKQSTGSRADECVEFTQSIVDIERVIVGTGDDVQTIEEFICMGVQNVTSCSGKEDVFEKVECVVDAISSFMTSFHTDGSISDIINKLKASVQELVKHFEGCFLNVHKQIDSDIQTIIEEKCHPMPNLLRGFN